VENASFMPWLMGTALLHSATVTEKRGALASWTALLGIAAFTLSIMGAFLVRSGVLTSVHAFAVDPKRGVLLLAILGLAAGGALALYAWRAPTLKDEGAFQPVSREGALFLNNVLLAAATATVLIGTLLPLIRSAIDGTPISVGAPYYNLTFTALVVPALVVVPAGALLAWKRGDLANALAKLRGAALAALAAFALAFALALPHSVIAALGVGLGVWVVAGALAEAAERVRLFRAPLAETARRAAGLPRGAWGMTLAHLGLGLFALGAAYETAYRSEAAEVLSLGQSLSIAGYDLRLESARQTFGPNFEAERVFIRVTDGAGRLVCNAAPERRLYAADGQTVSGVAICARPLDDLYIVSGEPRASANGGSAFLVRAYWNPWVRFVFAGPLLMALGGILSLSDRRLRFAAAARERTRARAAPAPAE
jgi:cytochrome c-type biogenesis protein CcmF